MYVCNAFISAFRKNNHFVAKINFSFLCKRNIKNLCLQAPSDGALQSNIKDM